VQNEWRRSHRPTLHGWVYALDDGLLKQLVTIGADSKIDRIYEWDDAEHDH
jgi:carbonic anhydrase